MSATFNTDFSASRLEALDFTILVVRTAEALTAGRPDLISSDLSGRPDTGWTFNLYADFDADEQDATAAFVTELGTWLHDLSWRFVNGYSVAVEALYEHGVVRQWASSDFSPVSYTDPETDADSEGISRCVICGDPTDYCQGHGEDGSVVWDLHDIDVHGQCHVDACREAAIAAWSSSNSENSTLVARASREALARILHDSANSATPAKNDL